jgi:pimeloyl-ACP methyl ester carboxylesterase
VLGDYLSRKKNPLAQPMQVIFQGEPLAISAAGEWPASAAPTGKILLLVHGLCMDESGWSRDAHNHGEALAEALQMTPIYLRYNTGLHVSENGAGLSELLEELLAAWPVAVEELVLVAHSMGGLVSRSAVHLAQTENKAWVNKLHKMVFLGTPHHGTSLEKVGNHVHALLDSLPYTKPLAKIGGLRSAGITDLRFGNLLEQDWAPHGRFERHTDARQPLPLSPEIRSYAIAATLGADENDLKSTLAGDGLVPLDSALGQHGNPAQQLAFAGTQTLYKTGHLELLGSQTAFAVMKEWLKE